MEIQFTDNSKKIPIGIKEWLDLVAFVTIRVNIDLLYYKKYLKGRRFVDPNRTEENDRLAKLVETVVPKFRELADKFQELDSLLMDELNIDLAKVDYLYKKFEEPSEEIMKR